MINVGKIFPRIFGKTDEVSCESVDNLANKVSSIGPSVSTAAPVMKQRAAGLLIKYNADSAMLLNNLVTMFDDVGMLPKVDAVPWYLSSLSAFDNVGARTRDQAACRAFRERLVTARQGLSSDSGVNATTGDGAISQIHIKDNIFAGVNENGSYGGTITWIYLGDSDSYRVMFAEVTSGTGFYEYLVGEMFLCVANEDSLDENALDSMIFLANETLNTNSFYQEVVSAAARTGNIDYLTVKSISDSFGMTDGISSLLKSIQGSNKISLTTIMTLILQIIDNCTGSDVTDSGFSPYELPAYCTDVLALAWKIVSTTVATVLSAIFNAVGYILSAVWALVTTMVDWIQGYITQTISKINKVCETPTWNVPMTPAIPVTLPPSVAKVVLDEFYNHGVAYIPLTDYVNRQGVVGYLVLYPEALSPDPDTASWDCKAQILIAASKAKSLQAFQPTGQAHTYVIAYDATTGDGTIDYRTLAIEDAVSATQEGFYEYVMMDDNDRKHMFFQNYISVLNLLGVRPSTNAQTHEYLLTKVSGAKPTTHWGLGTALISGRYVCSASDSVEMQIISSLLANGEMSNNWTYTNFKEDVVDKIYAWDSLKWQGIIQSYLTNHKSLCVAINQVDPFPFVYNPEINSPSIDYPEVSVEALIVAATVVAISTAAIAVSALAVKRSLKKKAVANLAMREEDFNQAKQDMLANPSKENINKFYKANIKLTRAWNRAGRFGVSMFNGFSTGSSAISSGSGIGSSLSEIQAMTSPSNASLETIMYVLRGNR